MTVETITLDLPDILYQGLKRRAEQTHRTVEIEMLEVVAAAVPATEDLSTDLSNAMSQLTVLDDAELWRAARSHLAPEAAAEMERLHHKCQSEGLVDAEAEALASLVRQYERSILVRAKAAALLRERGHDVNLLLAPA